MGLAGPIARPLTGPLARAISSPEGAGEYVPPAPSNLRAVADANYIAWAIDDGFTSTGFEDSVFALPYTIGSWAADQIILSFNNFNIATGFSAGIRNPTHGYRIKKAFLVHRDGSYVQVTLGGQTTWDVEAGENDLQSDAIDPSDFGLEAFQRGDAFVLKAVFSIIDGDGDVDVNGEIAHFPFTSIAGPPSGFRHLKAPADTYPDAALQTYAGITTQGSSTTGGIAPPVVMLGTFANDAEPVVLVGAGDSITAHLNDSTMAMRPSGFFGRSLVDDVSAPTLFRAGLNMGCPSGIAEAWTYDAQATEVLQHWAAYGNVAIEHYGVNGGTYAKIAAARAAFKSAPRSGSVDPVVIALAVTGRTSSTDGWDTLGNQTITGGGPGSGLHDNNIASEADVGTDIEYYVDSLAWRGASDPSTNDYWKWPKIGGVPSTDDGLHPDDVAHEAVAEDDLRPLLLTIEAGWPALPVSAPWAFREWMWGLTNPATDGDLSVTINGLPDDNGDAITSIWYTVDGGSLIDSGGIVSFTISGLSNGASHSVKLYAENAEGISEFDSDTKSATPTVGETTILEDLFDTDTSASYSPSQPGCFVVTGGNGVLTPTTANFPIVSRNLGNILTVGHEYRWEWGSAGTPGENMYIGSSSGGNQYVNVFNQAPAAGKSGTFTAVGTACHLTFQSFGSLAGAPGNALSYSHFRLVDKG